MLLLLTMSCAADVSDEGFAVPIVLDNLIHKGELPPTIAVFVTPGQTDAYSEQRSLEYDTVSDANASFLCEQLLPKVESRFNISDDPAKRCVCGLSSGGIAAFSVAWFRPEQFGCVISWIGSFTNIRGGHNYPWLIRNNVRKPIRVFLQDGENDLNNQHGSWPMANRQVYAALQYAGYDAKLEWGEGNHSGTHGASVLPDTLRWLWGSASAKL